MWTMKTNWWPEIKIVDVQVAAKMGLAKLLRLKLAHR